MDSLGKNRAALTDELSVFRTLLCLYSCVPFHLLTLSVHSGSLSFLTLPLFTKLHRDGSDLRKAPMWPMMIPIVMLLSRSASRLVPKLPGGRWVRFLSCPPGPLPTSPWRREPCGDFCLLNSLFSAVIPSILCLVWIALFEFALLLIF